MNKQLDNPTRNFLTALMQHDSFSYSGRGMYGQRCVAVTVTGSIPSTVAHIIESYVEDFGDSELSYIVGFFETSETDSLGRNLVLYFPTIEYIEENSLDNGDLSQDDE